MRGSGQLPAAARVNFTMGTPMLRHVLIALVTSSVLVLPASGQAVATVCKDGSSSATSGRGACSGHGGVDAKAMKQAAKATKEQGKTSGQVVQPAAPVVTCGDGSTSRGGRGACSRHGGVKVAGMTPSAAAPPTAAMPAQRSAPAPRSAPTTSTPTRSYPTPTASAPARTYPAPAAAPAATQPVPRATGPTTAAAPTTSRSNANDPTGATAQCRDGTYSHASTHRGACSRHQGVAKWL